ncbi:MULTISPECIES: hypothetical protein [unclassified Agrococcus]|uniref:hypothetical protein n=1 Tax=unclassified Agrococcus TaxID=2615065 RepID=UPI00361A1A79
MQQEHERWDERGSHEQDRIPPELDPAYDHFDDGPSRTMANRLRPLIWVGALIALVAMTFVFVL